VIFREGGAMTIIAMNFKMTPKQMLGFHETISIFVICLDSKSMIHFSIITKCYGTVNTRQLVTVPPSQQRSKELPSKITHFSG
jgi:hypothetical protein